MEMEPKEDCSVLQNKTTSPFSDLYQMIKNSLDVKTPRKSTISLLQTPTSRFCTPKPVSIRRNVGNPVIATEVKSTHKKDEVEVIPGADESMRQTDSLTEISATEMNSFIAEDVAQAETTLPQKRNRSTPQRFTACEVADLISAQKSPMRSKEATPSKQAVTPSKTEPQQKASPRNSGKVEKCN